MCTKNRPQIADLFDKFLFFPRNIFLIRLGVGSVCEPKIDLQFWASFVGFKPSRRTIFLTFGWVGQGCPGPRAPPPPGHSAVA